MDRITCWTFAALLLAPCGAAAQNQSHAALCPEPARNRVVFDHYQGSVKGPKPAVLELRDGEVLEIRFCRTLPSRFDYEISPIDADKERKTSFKSPEGKVLVDTELTTTSLSWKHREEFSLYRVSVTIRAGETNPAVTDEKAIQGALQGLPHEQAQTLSKRFDTDVEFLAPDDLDFRAVLDAAQKEDSDFARKLKPTHLYSYTFPVWVKTVAWTLSVTSGLAFSDLQDPEFFIEANGQEGGSEPGTDEPGTGDAGDDSRRVRRDRGAEGDSRPDLVLFANLVTPDAGWWSGRWKREKDDQTAGGAQGDADGLCCRLRRFLGGRLGLAFGLGLNGDGKARYYFGPSWTIGRKNHFVLAAGWTGGEVKRLPGKQALGAAPVDDNVLNELDSSFEHGFFAGLTFSFNPRQEQDFASALNGKAGRTDTGKETESNGQGANGPKPGEDDEDPGDTGDEENPAEGEGKGEEGEEASAGER